MWNLLFQSYTLHCPSYALCSFHTILPKQDMCIHNPKTLLYGALPGIPSWMLFCLANSLWCFKSQLQYYLASLVFPILVLYTNVHSPQGSQNHQRQLPQHSIRIMGVASWLHCRPHQAVYPVMTSIINQIFHNVDIPKRKWVNIIDFQ